MSKYFSNIILTTKQNINIFVILPKLFFLFNLCIPYEKKTSQFVLQTKLKNYGHHIFLTTSHTHTQILAKISTFMQKHSHYDSNSTDRWWVHWDQFCGGEVLYNSPAIPLETFSLIMMCVWDIKACKQAQKLHFTPHTNGHKKAPRMKMLCCLALPNYILSLWP